MATILLVEDDETLAMGLQFALQNEGQEVRVATRMEEGWQQVQSCCYDLILLDVTLPDGDGFMLCRKIREISSVPILFLTAREEEVHVVRGLDLGGDDYITKPFRLRELLSRIHAALRRSQTVEQQVRSVQYESDGLVLDTEQHRVMKNGITLELTPIEYKLLLFLFQHRGQVISRSVMLEKIWDVEGDFIDNNTLSVHIRRLREKIEEDVKQPSYIHTVRGVGYRFV
ncbi:response regulator transcription factor [Mechercharimyces sp. CAU 1602]|uniref:response regulator transcription factor n=1 Tax=Mechercharimyces sp. CAU 1602 TaxID=2973933 RepID=UPI002163A8B4|nr:response regulator transcription factor [Mechercharimyces sp. CAU 1602]MCS1350852.1 response regulator transcription factor [Mechercharimyces sp. CAU 1602]